MPIISQPIYFTIWKFPFIGFTRTHHRDIMEAENKHMTQETWVLVLYAVPSSSKLLGLDFITCKIGEQWWNLACREIIENMKQEIWNKQVWVGGCYHIRAKEIPYFVWIILHGSSVSLGSLFSIKSTKVWMLFCIRLCLSWF